MARSALTAGGLLSAPNNGTDDTQRADPIALAERLTAAKNSRTPPQHAHEHANRRGEKRKQQTLVQHKEAALQRALADKQRRRARRKNGASVGAASAAAVCSRAEEGSDALAAIVART